MANWKDVELSELELSSRTSHALARAGFTTLRDALALGDRLLRLENFGRKSFNELNELASEMGAPTPQNVSLWRTQSGGLERRIAELEKQISAARLSLERVNARLAEVEG